MHGDRGRRFRSKTRSAPAPIPSPFACALLLGSTLLAVGPWLVRLAGIGPVAAGFWRLALALPFLFLLARIAGQPVHWPRPRSCRLVAVAAFFFAADLAAWHAGIHMTKLANATLFGNVSSFAFAAWGLWLARSWPTRSRAPRWFSPRSAPRC